MIVGQLFDYISTENNCLQDGPKTGPILKVCIVTHVCNDIGGVTSTKHFGSLSVVSLV